MSQTGGSPGLTEPPQATSRRRRTGINEPPRATRRRRWLCVGSHPRGPKSPPLHLGQSRPRDNRPNHPADLLSSTSSTRDKKTGPSHFEEGPVFLRHRAVVRHAGNTPRAPIVPHRHRDQNSMTGMIIPVAPVSLQSHSRSPSCLRSLTSEAVNSEALNPDTAKVPSTP